MSMLYTQKQTVVGLLSQKAGFFLYIDHIRILYLNSLLSIVPVYTSLSVRVYKQPSVQVSKCSSKQASRGQQSKAIWQHSD
jgi:hypothetical protein